MRNVRSPRWEVTLDCRYAWDDAQSEYRPQDGRLTELSAQGAFVEATSIPERGTQLIFCFQNGKDDEEYEFTAKVLHCGWYEQDGRPVQGFAVRFISSTAETSRRLRDLLEGEISSHSKFAKEKRSIPSRRLPSEAELEQRALRYKAFFEESDLPHFIADYEGRILHFNLAAQKLLGYEGEEIFSLSDEALFDSSFDRQEIHSWLQKKPLREREAVFVHQDGTPIACSLFATPRKAGDGTVLGYNAALVDRRRDKQVRELEQRRRSLEVMSGFARCASQELNDRLSSVLASVEACKKSLETCGTPVPVDSETGRRLEQATASVHKAMDFTRLLQSLSESSSLDLEVIEPSRLVHQAIAQLEMEFGQGSGCRLVSRLEALGRTRADPAWMLEAFRNLVDNSRRAMNGNARIEFATRDVHFARDVLGNCSLIPAGSYVRFSVRDNGSGIGLHPTGDVVLPFVTSHHSALGLGLSAVWGIVASHGGYIEIPETVTGTRIDLYLPALR